MTHYPPMRRPATAEQIAAALVVAVVEAGLVPSPELIALLLAQSGGETGGWKFCYCWNLGNAKASDTWVKNGGGYTYHDTAAPGLGAPVSEWLPRAQAQHALSSARPRTDGQPGMDAVVVKGWDTGGDKVYMHFFPSHRQARFRAFATLADGAKNYVEMLRDRFPEAVQAASRGDVTGYVVGLRSRGYFTAPLDVYLRGVRANLSQYMPIAKKAVTPKSTPTTSSGAFRSMEADLEIHWSGWHQLKSGALITRLPVWDRHHDMAARMGWRPIASWMDVCGMRLAAHHEMTELHMTGTYVAPLTMPTAAQLSAAGVPRTETEINRFRSRHMMSYEWCAEHDAEMMRRLDALDWDGSTPVANFGKHWVQGGIHGWWRRPPPSQELWQPYAAAHRGEPTYADYGTTSHAVLIDLAKYQLWLASLFELGAASEERFGLRALSWLGYQYGIDPVEVPGPVHHPLILSYSAPCRRSGMLLGKDAGGLVWDGGYSTAAPSDEWAWCAILQSGRLLEECLHVGEAPPHGARVAVWELVEDMRSNGRLHLAKSDYVPQPGDLAFEARDGQSPLYRGKGHVWCVSQYDEGSEVASGVGGNEDNRIQFHHDRPISQVLAWGQR